MRRSLIHTLLSVTYLFAFTAADGAEAQRPVLGSPEQIESEKRILKAVEDPRVLKTVAQVRASLSDDPAARTEAGRAGLDHAVSLWLYALAMSEIASDTSRPAFRWSVNNSPYGWFGHVMPGSGGSGDNPDNIYRGAYIDGSLRYEIRGRIPKNPPEDFSLEIVQREPAQFGFLKPKATVGKGHADVGDQIAMLRGEDLRTDAGGNFIVTLGPDAADGRPNHIQTPPMTLGISFRNTLSNWGRTPVEASIRRTDAGPSRPKLTDEELIRKIAADLPDWVRSWTTVKEKWLGPPPPNTLAPVLPREGGWGFVSGGQYDLKDNEALLVTISDGGAGYTGFALFDRWYLASDARSKFNSLNNSQAVRNPDATTTYIIALSDPGVTNWLDASSSPQGFISIRWQKALPHTEASTLLKDVRLVKLAELSSALPQGFPRITPAERTRSLARRAADYDNRIIAAIK